MQSNRVAGGLGLHRGPCHGAARFKMQRPVARVNALCTNSLNLCALSLTDSTTLADDDSCFGITSSRLVYNAAPTKISAVNVLSTCIDLARRELDEFYISNVMCTHTYLLHDICKALLGEFDLDAVWRLGLPTIWQVIREAATFVFGLTDLDIQAAVAFERYGSEEVRRQSGSASPLSHAQEGQIRFETALLWVEFDDTASTASCAYNLALRRRLLPTTRSPRQTQTAHADVPRPPPPTRTESSSGFGMERSSLRLGATYAGLAQQENGHDAALDAREAGSGTEIAENLVLQNVSLQNASNPPVCFVGRRVDDIPPVVAVYARNLQTRRMEQVSRRFGWTRRPPRSTPASCHPTRSPCFDTGIVIMEPHQLCSCPPTRKRLRTWNRRAI